MHTCYLMVLLCFYCVASTELGTVSRNCTEYGWSDIFPHYVDACVDGNGSHVVGTGFGDRFQISVSDVGWLNLFLCLSGHVLCVGEGSVHGGLQHLSGLPHHRHGYPVQVQVRWSSLTWVSGQTNSPISLMSEYDRHVLIQSVPLKRSKWDCFTPVNTHLFCVQEAALYSQLHPHEPLRVVHLEGDLGVHQRQRAVRAGRQRALLYTYGERPVTRPQRVRVSPPRVPPWRAALCLRLQLECRAVMIFFHYCVLSNYFWLFIEGLYLFTLLVETFFPEKRYFYWYIIIGWGETMWPHCFGHVNKASF